MRVPDLKMVALKRVWLKDWKDTKTVREFIKVRTYMDKLIAQDRKYNKDPEMQEEFTEEQLDDGIFRDMNERGIEYYLLYIDDTDIGYTSIKFKPHPEIISLYIDEKYRGKGYGRFVINKMKKYLLDRTDSKDIIFRTGMYNKRAQKLYEALGFKVYKKDKYHVYYKG